MHILLIDPSWTRGAMLSLTIKPLGWEIANANNATQALAQIARQQPDVIIVDAMHPHMLDNGNLLRMLRARTAAHPIPVLLLGRPAPPLPANIQPDAVLQKPFRTFDLIAALRAFADSDQLAQIDELLDREARRIAESGEEFLT